jgi:hypothetical protein
MAEAGLQRRAAVREYVGISVLLELDYRDVQPCGSTLVSKDGWSYRDVQPCGSTLVFEDGWSWMTETCSRTGVRWYL